MAAPQGVTGTEREIWRTQNKDTGPAYDPDTDSLQAASDKLDTIITAITGTIELKITWSEDSLIEDDQLLAFNIGLIDVNSGAVASANIDITGISATMERSRAGGAFSSVGITQPVFAKADGRVYYDYRFLAAEWQVGDSYKLLVSGIECTVSGTVLYIPNHIWSNQVVENVGLAADVTSILAAVTATTTVKGVIAPYTADLTGAGYEANAGDKVMFTATTQDMMLTGLALRAKSSQTADLTSAAVSADVSKRVSIFNAAQAARVNIADEGNQIGWTGRVLLPVGSTVVVTLAGTGANTVDLEIVAEAYPMANGGTLA